MKVTYENSIEYQMRNIIAKSKSVVVLREDFDGLGSYRQISRVLKKLVDAQFLVKISFGVYAKSYVSEYIDEPLIKNGFEVAAREALDRLGIAWESSRAERAYNEGLTQQVPVNNAVRLKTRCRRNIGYNNRQLQFEDNINAR